MCQFHEDVTVEYMRRLLKGEVKLKDRERQDQAYMLVKSNAERLHSLFSRMVRIWTPTHPSNKCRIVTDVILQNKTDKR